MTDLTKRTALVYDYGLFAELAVTLADHFGRVLYFAPWANGAPTSRVLRIGQGLDGIERVDELWPYIDEVDLFVFPDVYEPGLQEYLVSIGKRVWGCRGGAELELDRFGFKETCADLGIDMPPYDKVVGLAALRRHLKANADRFVKVSTTRGDMETFHARDYAAVEQQLDLLEQSLGPKKKVMEFLVEEAVNDAVEAGYDGYAIDGKFPRGALVGVETKCEAYLGKAMDYADLPAKVREVNRKLGPALRRYQYRGFISTEIRIKGEKAYLIDPCCRCGSPPSELYQMMIANLGEVMWEGAAGVVIEPDYRAKWGAMMLLTSEFAGKNWQHVSFPAAIREHVKLRRVTVIDGETYVIPDTDEEKIIGAVVATGATADKAIAECRRIAEKVEGLQIAKSTEALDKAREQLAKVLGDKMDDKPKSRLERRADDARARGQISEHQYDKRLRAEA